MTLMFFLKFQKKILVKSPYYEKGKKREKGNTTLFSQLLNPTQEITPLTT